MSDASIGYDPFSVEFQEDPFPFYRWMRDEEPVYRSDKWGFWALSRFEDVRAAALDPQTFLSFEGIDIDDTAKDQSGPGFLPDIDNPRHDQLRKLVQQHFLPRSIAKLEESIRTVVQGLVGSWRDESHVDIAQQLSWPLPYEVFFDLLGMPMEQDRHALISWSHQLKDREPGDPRLTPIAKAATANINAYLADLLAQRRRDPRDDLLSDLVNSEIDGVPFAEADIEPVSEIVGLMFVLFLAGVETTAGLASTLFRALADFPEQRALLLKDPSLIPAAVDEAVRYATPLQVVGRTTARDVTLHGVTIPAGDRVFLVYGAANRDERQFPDPDRFDITRGQVRHLGFGEGLHGCLGAPLARLEVKVAAEEALPVLGEYTISSTPTRYRSTPNAYVLEHLPLSFSVPAAAPVEETVVTTTKRPAHLKPVSHRTTSVMLVTSEFEADVVVEAKEEVAEGIVALRLREVGDHPLPPWTPGAHVDLILPDAPTRQYSLCGDPADHHLWRLGVLKDPNGRGSSLYVHDHLQAGDRVRVRGPRNNFPLVASPRYLFIAGGIGITPILPMIAKAEETGTPWSLVYGGRQRSSMAFVDELDPYGERVSICPQDETGQLDLAGILGVPQDNTQVYCCGPEPLLAAVEEHCAAWPSRSLHVERFKARPLSEPAMSEMFQVVLARSELTLTVSPEQSILSVVEEAGVGVLSSCAEGTCGTCETAVLEGDPDHRDSVLTEEERRANDCMMICISRSRTPRLVLDL